MYLGINPNLCGWWAILDEGGGLLREGPVPTVTPPGKRPQLDRAGVRGLVAGWAMRGEARVVVLEAPGVGMGGSFAAAQGAYQRGVWLATLEGCGLAPREVVSSAWTRALGVQPARGTPGDRARPKADPEQEAAWKARKPEGKAATKRALQRWRRDRPQAPPDVLQAWAKGQKEIRDDRRALGHELKARAVERRLPGLTPPLRARGGPAAPVHNRAAALLLAVYAREHAGRPA